MEIELKLPKPHIYQQQAIKCLYDDEVRRVVIQGGRRGGKTRAASMVASLALLARRNVVYAAPTSKQTKQFWQYVLAHFEPIIKHGLCKVNHSTKELSMLMSVKLPDGQTRMRWRYISAQTAWRAENMRSQGADVLIFDEAQAMARDVWDEVGAPILIDSNGIAYFIFTPPSLRTTLETNNNRAGELARYVVEMARDEQVKGWRYIHFTSLDNPYISHEAIAALEAGDISSIAYRQEILAEMIDEAQGALWSRAVIEQTRVRKIDALDVIVVAIDPAATVGRTGIIVAGKKTIDNEPHFFVLEDLSGHYEPSGWAMAAIEAYHRYKADYVVAEINQGGKMVKEVLAQYDASVPIVEVRASRGKTARAHPIAILWQQGRGHIVGRLEVLENQMALWTPAAASPDNLDAMVWAGHSLMVNEGLEILFEV